MNSHTLSMKIVKHTYTRFRVQSETDTYTIKIRETEAETILNNGESSRFLILFVLPFLESPHSCFNFSLCFSYRFLLLDTNTIGTSLTNKYY